MERGPADAGAGGDGGTSGQREASGLLLFGDRCGPATPPVDLCLAALDCSLEGRSIEHTTSILTQDKHDRASRPAPPLLIPFRYKGIIESDVQAACFPFRARLFTYSSQIIVCTS